MYILIINGKAIAKSHREAGLIKQGASIKRINKNYNVRVIHELH